MDAQLSHIKFIPLPSISPVMELKCDVCTVSLFLQACQCKSGHNFCGYCYERMNVCPICQVPKLEQGSFTWKLVNDIKNSLNNPNLIFFDTSIPPPPPPVPVAVPVPVAAPVFNNNHLIFNQNPQQPPPPIMDYRHFLNENYFQEERSSFIRDDSSSLFSQNLRSTSS